jgi:hypothetical protein
MVLIHGLSLAIKLEQRREEEKSVFGGIFDNLHTKACKGSPAQAADKLNQCMAQAGTNLAD